MSYEQTEPEVQDPTHVALDQAKEALHRADVYVRENPIPTILGALAIGFALGILARGGESTPRSHWEELRERAEDAEDNLRSLLTTIGKKSRKAYKKGSSAVRDAVEEAADAARKIDVEDYTDPVTSWFRKLWK